MGLVLCFEVFKKSVGAAAKGDPAGRLYQGPGVRTQKNAENALGEHTNADSAKRQLFRY